MTITHNLILYTLIHVNDRQCLRIVPHRVIQVESKYPIRVVPVN